MSIDTTTAKHETGATERPAAAPGQLQKLLRSGPARVLIKRLAAVPLVLWALATLVFFALRLIPGSPATRLGTVGTDGMDTEQISANIHAINSQLGLDKSLPEQYFSYLWSILRFDFGNSFYGGNPVKDLVFSALPATVELTVAAMAMAVLIGALTGVIAAVWRGGWVDNTIRAFSTVAYSLPWFALGVMAIVVFAVMLGWFPVLGRLPNSLDYRPTTNFVLLDAVLQGRPDLIGPWLLHLALPATTLAISMSGYITRMVRAAVLDVLGDDFVRTARMKGISETRILSRHVARNSSLPVVTVLGLQFGSLLGGSVITEAVFSYPGIGKLLVSGVYQRDYLVVQGGIFAIGLLCILVNLLVDLIYLWLDPRLRKS